MHSSSSKEASCDPIKIGIPLYPNFDSLDVLGPFQTFSMQGDNDSYHLPSLAPQLLAETMDPVSSFENVAIVPHDTFDNTKSLDVLFVPGGIFLEKVLGDPPASPDNNPYLAFLRRIGAPGKDHGPMLITSVCTGALFLAAAGLLQGYRATTHWSYRSVLALFPGVTLVEGYPRFVIDANRITGGGISSGLDEAMVLVQILLGSPAAKRGQLKMQYAPDPPFRDGDPSVADPPTLFDVTNEWRGGVVATTTGFRKYIDKWGDEIGSI
jgi:cyclohexyl-isocyanide hydratase